MLIKWKVAGKIRRDLDDEFIFILLKSIFYIDIHKEEIGVQYFPQIMECITEYIMKGITDIQK